MLEPRLARLVLPRLDLISTHLTRFSLSAVGIARTSTQAGQTSDPRPEALTA